MSITLFEKTEGNFTMEIRQDKYSPLYIAIIYYYGKTIYKNYFRSLENAKKALKRNIKKY